MTQFSGAERLAAQHPDETFELTVTKDAKTFDSYRAAVTTFQPGEDQHGSMTGTGHGTAGNIGESIVLAVSDYTRTSGESEAVA